MKLLLVNPRFPESFWSFKWVTERILPEKKTTNPPLGLATVAAMCPEDWQVEIIDENIATIPLEPDVDLIGIAGMGVQFARQKELLSFYRKKGYPVVAGGSYASLCPEYYKSLADSVVSGEAEYIWPEFCRDFEAGKARELYQETGEVDLADSPVPRFDLLDLDKYRSVSLQFSRGCPFRCEFCDIIVMFGRKPRTKSLEQIGRELDLLRQQNIQNPFFVDDNLIGNKPLAKKLLAFLKEYQKKNDYEFHFGTEASLNLAQDEELLNLFVEANFNWIFIGIESPDEKSLKETKKYQNTRHDILASVRQIYAYGIDVYGGFIIGFDNDTQEVFEKQFDFIMQSGIQAAMIGLLTALEKTPLYDRVKKEGRLIHQDGHADNTKLTTNLIPLRMSVDEMIRGYQDLYFRLLEPRNIGLRVSNKIRFFADPVSQKGGSPGSQLRILKNFIHALAASGISSIYHFIRSIPLSRPRLLPLVIQEWIIGLSMRDYVTRHFILEFKETNQLTHNYLMQIEKSLHRYIREGGLELSLRQVKNTAAQLSLHLKGVLDRRFFVRVGNHLEKILRDTTSSVSLHIEELHDANQKHLNHLLKRLSRHGDRIHIALNERLLPTVQIDSSVFNLVLESG